MDDNNQGKKSDTSRCVVKAIMRDQIEPNEISIEAIHASCIRLITNFVRQPSPVLAQVVVNMLDALAKHDGSFRTESGHNIYQQAAAVWQGILDNMGDTESRNYAERVVH